MTVLRSQEGQIAQVLTDKVCIKLKSKHSPNSMTVMTVDVPPEGSVPPHTHAKEEESYYMLEGSMVMQVGSEELTLEPGDFAHVPPGTVHGYRNCSDQPIRFLAWTVGGLIDEFFVEMSTKIQDIPNDLPKMPEILEKYGIQVAYSPEA